MPNHHAYGPTASPFLPLTDGRFEFALPHSGDDGHAVQVCRIFSVILGDLVVPSGKLVVTDPFQAMQRVGNHVITVPTGRHEARVTVADISNPNEAANNREAYLSLVLDAAALTRRQAWQAQRFANGTDPSVPKHALRHLHLTADGSPPENLAEFDEHEFIGVTVNAVTVALVDAECLEKGMPEETIEQNWYDTLFIPGVSGSWFDVMDNDRHIGPNKANIVLPRMYPTPFGPGNLVLTQTGWGNDVYPVVAEYAFDTGDGSVEGHDDEPRLIAVHVNFFVVPCATSPVDG